MITIFFPSLPTTAAAAAAFLTAVGATTFLATAFLAFAIMATVSFFFLDFVAVLAALVTDSFFVFFVVVVSFFAGAGEGAVDSGSTATALLDNRVDFLVEETMILFPLFLFLINDRADTAQGKAKV